MAIKISGSTIIDDSRGIVNAGISTFNNDVTFLGASYNATWDKSDNSLIFADSAKAKFGTGGDLEVCHNGSRSYIKNSQGQLDITTASTTNGNDINIYSKTSVNINVNSIETAATFASNGAVTLYHNGSSKFCK